MYSADFYLPGVNMPEIYRGLNYGDHVTKDNREVTEPFDIPMPFIRGKVGERNRVIITHDWYVKQKKLKAENIAKDKRLMQVEMMELLAQRDRLRARLGKLDSSKKKDAKKIISINIRLKDIQTELDLLHNQSGIIVDELDHGTKFGRFIGNIQRAAHKVAKKVKKFYKRHEELITGLASIVLPVVTAGLLGKIAKLLV